MDFEVNNVIIFGMDYVRFFANFRILGCNQMQYP